MTSDDLRSHLAFFDELGVDGVRLEPEQLRAIATAAGRPAAERTTTYDRIEPSGIRYRIPA